LFKKSKLVKKRKNFSILLKKKQKQEKKQLRQPRQLKSQQTFKVKGVKAYE